MIATEGPSSLADPTVRLEAAREEILRRLTNIHRIRERAEKDPRTYALLHRYYTDHVVDWINDWVVTYDPREPLPLRPMRLWPRQVEFINWLDGIVEMGGDAVGEKSRDWGASWLCMAYALHGWIFKPGWKANFGANKADNVDVLGDPDSLFEKGRILLQNLPWWQLPPRWEQDSGYMKFVNKTNGAVISGGSGDNIGRGGRCKVLFLDEAAFIARAESVNAATSATSNCRLWLSTPNGQGNPFALKRFSLPEERVCIMDWHDDPRKDEDWGRREKERIGPVAFARECDRDYTASVEGIAIKAEWVKAAIELYRRGAVKPSAVATCGLDIGGGGAGKTVHITRRGPVVAQPTAWIGGDTTADAFRAVELTKAAKADRLFYDSIGVGTGVGSTLRRIEGVRSTGVNVGEEATDRSWPDGRRAKEWFRNFKAELWWTMRDRFIKAYEQLHHLDGDEDGVKHPEDELIALPPGAHELAVQLSQPIAKYTNTGKIIMESKDEMQRRGIPSPDFADALALTFAHDRRAMAVKRVRGMW